MIKKLSFIFFCITRLLATNTFQDVTVSEYTHFLNVVAKEDPFALYDQKMGCEEEGGMIKRIGEPGRYRYFFCESQQEESVTYVNLLSAMRFCNWKENGEKEDPLTMEYGVYELEGEKLLRLNLNERTRYMLPSQQSEEDDLQRPCLRLEESCPEDFSLRSNQVVFHVETYFENQSSVFSKEEQNTLWDNAEYLIGTVAALATIASYVNCPQYCSLIERPKERMITVPLEEVPVQQNEVVEEGGLNAIEESKSDSLVLSHRERQTQEQQFFQEIEAIVKKDLLQRANLANLLEHHQVSRNVASQQTDVFREEWEWVLDQGEPFVSFLKKNFSDRFPSSKIKEFEKKVEVYNTELEEKINDQRRRKGESLQSRALSAIHHSWDGVVDALADKHKAILKEVKEFCYSFDEHWTLAKKATCLQVNSYRSIKEYSETDEVWFYDRINAIDENIKNYFDNLDASQLKKNALKKYFEDTFRKELKSSRDYYFLQVGCLQKKATVMLEGIKKFLLCGFDSDTAFRELTEEYQHELAKESESLIKELLDGENRLGEMFLSTERYYDATHHTFPPLTEEERQLGITEDQIRLIAREADRVNNRYALSSYPREGEEEKHLAACVKEQYQAIVAALKANRELSSSFYSGVLDREKPLLHYFLKILEASPFGLIREEAASLKQQLNNPS